MTEMMPETSSQPGLILKTAREEMSLSIEQVAQELHLRPAVVKALEEEKYSEFSSDVFLKGYFRTYCRLVKLHEERMIELLEKQLNSIKQATDRSQEEIVKASQSRKRRKRFITFLIFLLCTSLVYLAYRFSTQGIDFSSSTDSIETSEAESGQIIEPQSSEASEAPSDSTRFSSEEAAENNQASMINALPQEDNFPESIDQAELKENQQITDDEVPSNIITEESSTNLADADSSELEETAASEPEINQITEPAILASLKVTFSGDCWFKLTDGNGKTAIADLKRENEQINYQGVTPFHIVIGDASNASLTFEGELIDLAAYSSRNGRAELTLNASDAQARGE